MHSRSRNLTLINVGETESSHQNEKQQREKKLATNVSGTVGQHVAAAQEQTQTQGKQISTSKNGAVMLTENGETKKVGPGWLLASVLSQKRIGLTEQYVNLIQKMNDTNQEADTLRVFMGKLRANKPEDSISAHDFQTKIIDEVKVSHPGFDANNFNWESYKSDGKFTKDKVNDMIEDVRNSITSKNNLNSQTQLKVKMTEMFRNETIEWQNTLYDHIGKVFDKIYQ